jgi:hypothetical protein
MPTMTARPQLAAVAAAVISCCIAANAHAALPDASSAVSDIPAEAPEAAGAAASAQYSVVNLGPHATTALLNARGQAAFSHVADDDPRRVMRNWFFDGSCVQPIASLGGPWSWLRGINRHGVVVGESEVAQPIGSIRAFYWTAATGTQALRSSGSSSAYAINDQNQVAGLVWLADGRAMASRWHPGGILTTLGSMPSTLSMAYAINDKGETTGAADDAAGLMHGMVWSQGGAPTGLDGFGGFYSAGEFINASGQVAGTSFRGARQLGFFWSARHGTVTLGPEGGAMQYVSALNDDGVVAGNNQYNNGGPALYLTPLRWSARGGLRTLPLGGAAQGAVWSLNNRGAMVGFVERTLDDWTSRRAVLWRGVAKPVDLNTRLHRAPAGLVLYSARAINDKGVILADSNAGLVLLRPGTQGTAAPVMGPIAGASANQAFSVNKTVEFSAGFVDSSATESHVAHASVNDDCPQLAPSLREARGSGDITTRHTFCRPGAFTVRFEVKDGAGNATQVQGQVFVNDPSVPTLVGQGALAPARSGSASPRFTVWAPLAGGSRGAAASFEVSGPFQFSADAVEKPDRSKESLLLRGTGRLNGRTGYRFSALAQPQPGGQDRLRLRISHTDAATRAEVVDYDNGPLAMTPAAPGMAGTAASADRTLVIQGKLQLAQ